MPFTDRPNCTEQEFQDSLERVIETMEASASSILYIDNVRPVGYVLGGQPGSGKSNLIRLLRKKYDSNIVAISGDDFRPYHPYFAEYQTLYNEDSPKYTARFSSLMTEAVIKHFVEKRYNLVIEGTFRTSQTPINTLQMLRDNGYKTGCLVQLCNKELSWKSCQERYERMKERKPIMARAVDKAHHDYVVEHITNNIKAVYDSKLADIFEIYERHEDIIKKIFSSEKSNTLDIKRLNQVLGLKTHRSIDYDQER